MNEFDKIVKGQRVVIINARYPLEPTALVGVVQIIDGQNAEVRVDEGSSLYVSLANVFPIQNAHALRQFT
jgi:hypothetical protein